MATSPAKAPFIIIERSGLPDIPQIVIMADIAPAAAAKFVLIATLAIKLPSPAPSVEPGLKPNQPNHRINTPRDARGIE